MVENPQSVDWNSYYFSIRAQCPWSWLAWSRGLIDHCHWQGQALPLDHYEARVYQVIAPNSVITELVQQLSLQLDQGECTWLFSYPGYGEYATPVPVLIQQHRHRLDQLRSQLNYQE